MKKYISIAVIWAFALPMVIFGLNKFLLFANVAPPEGAQAQAFLGAMFSSYLAKLVGITEIIGGLLMLNRRTSFIGLLLLSPVIVNIAVFHLAHDMPGNGIWIFSTAAYLVSVFLHREQFKALVPSVGRFNAKLAATTVLVLLSTIAFSQVTSYTKEKISNAIILKGDVAAVWNNIKSFGNLEAYVPGVIEKTVVKGKGAGAERSIYLANNNGVLVEKLVNLNERKRVIRYKTITTPMPVNNYTGTMQIKKLPDGSYQLEFTSVYTVAADKRETMASVFDSFQKSLLANINK